MPEVGKRNLKQSDEGGAGGCPPSSVPRMVAVAQELKAAPRREKKSGKHEIPYKFDAHQLIPVGQG